MADATADNVTPQETAPQETKPGAFTEEQQAIINNLISDRVSKTDAE